MSTDRRPSVDQLLTDTSVKYRPTIDQLSAKCRRNVGEVSVNEKLYRPRHIWNDYRPCLDRVSTDYRPLCRPTVDRVSTEYRPSVDRVSTDCRPTIDRVSTEYRPTVDRVSPAISTAISTDISVDITQSKQDPSYLVDNHQKKSKEKRVHNVIIQCTLNHSEISQKRKKVNIIQL